MQPTSLDVLPPFKLTDIYLMEGHSRPSRPRSVTRPAFSTFRRASSPFRPPPTDRTERQTSSKKPPVWRGEHSLQSASPNNTVSRAGQQRERGRGCHGADRPPVPPRSSSIDRMHRIGRDSPEPETCLTLGRNGRDCATLESDLTSARVEGGEERMEGGERSSSSSDA